MVSARTAVLLALRRGPVYGRALIRRIGRVTGGRMRVSAGTVYPALRALRSARLVTAWGVVRGATGGARASITADSLWCGRRREARALVELADARRRVGGPNQVTRDAMRARLLRVAELADAVARLRGSLARERRPA
jgi:DNA-binding PadR family transcriptional regulator